jgi:tetratricopeptide (TPR) repeat protein
MADAFISYVEEDRALAAEVAEVLRSTGLSSWRYEADTPGGTNYLLRTRSEIETCRVFLILLSPSTLGSEQVDREIVRAHECGKPFLPLLRDLNYVDFARRRPAWQQAMGAATALLIPEEGVVGVAERIVSGMREILGRDGAPLTSSWRIAFRRRLRSKRLLRFALVGLVVALAAAFGLHAYAERRRAENRKAATDARIEAARLLDAGRAEEAQPHLARALQLAPEDSEVHLLLGRMHRDLKEPELAIQHLDRRLSAEPRDALALYHRALARIDLGRDTEALPDLDAAIPSRSLPGDAWIDACYQRGLILLDRNAPAHPVRIELGPDARKEISVAEADFSAVYEQRGWNYALIERGRARSWLRRDEDARRDLDLAYRRATSSGRTDDAPMAAESAFLLGMIEMRSALASGNALELSRANESFDVALRHAPGILRYRASRAICRAGQGFVSEAISDLEQALAALTAEDPMTAHLARTIEEVRASAQALPVQDFRVEASRVDTLDAGPGIEFRVHARIHRSIGVPCRLNIRFYEGPDSPYRHHWRPLPARSPHLRGPEGHLLLGTTITPAADPHAVTDLRLFLPYSETPLYDGPQRYEFLIRFDGPSGPLSPAIEGTFNFTKGYR